jgi:hypothetical protein
MPHFRDGFMGAEGIPSSRSLNCGIIRRAMLFITFPEATP